MATCHEKVAIIKKVEQSPIVTSTFPPFYFVEGHSGAGKTQLPFAIEACGIPTVHLVLTKVCDSSQLIYKAFKEKSHCFQDAVMKDLSEGLKDTSDLSVDGLSSYDEHGLYTVVFILHELKVHGFDVKGVAPNPKALRVFIEQQVRARRADKLPVFVLDEALTSPIASDDSEALRQFRLARDIFRAIGLVVILMGTNSKAAKFAFTNHCSQARSEGGIRVWCRLIIQLPRITKQSMKVLVGANALRSLPEKHASLKQFLESQCLVNTPWFVQLVLEALVEIGKEARIADLNSCDLMDLMFKHVAAPVWEKKESENFLCGQFAMHLAWHKNHSEVDHQSNQKMSSIAVGEYCSISHHFGKPWHNNIDLYLRNREPSAEEDSSSAAPEVADVYYPATFLEGNGVIFELYESRSYFAGAEKECFMYLSFGGGNKAVDFMEAFRSGGNRISTERANINLDRMQRNDGRTLQYGNPNARSHSEDKLESLAGVAMEVASHEHGVRGGPVESFLGLVAAELFHEYPSSWTWRDGAGPREYLSSGLLKMIVPYLSSANDRWPDAIHLIPGCKFGNLIRSEDESQIDFAVETRPPSRAGNIKKKNTERKNTGEAKNHENAVNAKTMRDLLDRVPPSSQVHIVFASTVQEKYFTRDGTWEEFKSSAPHLLNTTFVKVEATRGEERNSVELSLEPMFNEETSRLNQNNRLVIFYPIEDMQRQLYESLEILNSDPQQLESSTGKRTRATSNAPIRAMPARKVKKRK